MTKLMHKLRERIQIKQPVQDPADDGGLTRSYAKVATIWADVKPVSSQSAGIAAFSAFVRGVQISSIATHIATVRRTAVSSIGGSFGAGQGKSFNSSADLEILKSEYFIFRQRGGAEGQFGAGLNNEFNQTEGLIGNLYSILSVEDVDSRKEYLRIRLMELEEQGVGAPA
jgi:hypothetical protein